VKWNPFTGPTHRRAAAGADWAAVDDLPIIDRRTFLTGAAAGMGSLALLADPDAAIAAARRRRVSRRSQLALDGRFRQSVASGQPGTHGITLWTRVDELERRSRLQVEISPDRDFRRIISRRDVFAEPRTDFTINERISGRFLKPGEEYFYRFYTCNTNSPVGRFRTARPADSREPVRIAFFSCQEFDSGFYTAHAELAKVEDLDLVVCLGDYIYEKVFDDRPVRRDTTGANGDGEVQTLAEYRAKYNLYHTDRNLLAVRAKFPLMSIWDDHEVEDNYAAERPGGQTDDRRLPFSRRRAAAYRAFFEHMPRVRVKADPDRIYGSIRLGGMAEVLFLDTRRFRDDQPNNEGDDGFAPSDPVTRADPSRTLLGREQKGWLKGALAASPARWKVVANQIMIMALDLPARQPLNTDQWDGYEAERRELLEFIRTSGLRDVTFVTGDIHTFFAGNVTPSGRQGLPSDGPSVATEFVGGSITSKGIADQAGEEPANATALPSDQNVLANNPHIRFSNQRFKGFGILEARADELLVEYRAVRTVQSRTSPALSLQRFRVAAGVPLVERLGGEAPPQAPVPLVEGGSLDGLPIRVRP
jgi:alkaline phosphatase D